MAAGAANWVWANSRAANGSLIVLLAIAHECGNDGAAEMSMPEIGRKARLSERAVRNAVKELARLGELSVTERPGGRNRYALCMTGEQPVSTTPAKSAGVPRQNLHPGKICTPEDSAGVKPDSQQVSKGTPAKSAGVGISDMFIPTGSTGAGVKDVPAKPPRRREDRPDVDLLCEHLASRIEGNGCKRPAITEKWRDAARLMLDKDGYTEQQVKAAIDWCQDNEFWRANILSMPKLREKYEQLRMQAMRERNGKARPTRQQETDDLFAAAMQRAKAREEVSSDPDRDGNARPLRQGALPAAGD